jgi:hypothetical protein
VAAIGLASAGCAQLGLGQPEIIAERTIEVSSQPVHRAGATTAGLEQAGTIATIRAHRACVEDEELLRTVERTERRDRFNQTPLVDLAYGVFGAASVAVGTWWVTSPRSVATSTLSPKEVSGLGAFFLLAGTALLAIPAIDAALASGSERAVTTATVPDLIVRKDTDCGDLPYAGAEITTLVQRQPVRVGVTDEAGTLKLDLAALPIALFAETERYAPLFLGAREFGNVDLEPVRRRFAPQDGQGREEDRTDR